MQEVLEVQKIDKENGKLRVKKSGEKPGEFAMDKMTSLRAAALPPAPLGREETDSALTSGFLEKLFQLRQAGKGKDPAVYALAHGYLCQAGVFRVKDQDRKEYWLVTETKGKEEGWSWTKKLNHACKQLV